jgi:3-hydroxymyristoyl/3-hydroxydecanoyl-(acyl carrier protein) dehydratase
VTGADPVPLSALPHGEPARLLTDAFLDRAAGIARGVRDAGDLDAHANESGFLPQCLLVELMEQTAGLALPEGSGGAYVAAIKRMRLRRAARRGERVEIEARLLRRIGPVFLFSCRATASGRPLADGSIALRAFGA